MKVALFTPEFPPNCGGIGYYVYYLSKELVKQGIEVTIIVRSRKCNRKYNIDEIPVYEVSCPGIPPYNFIFFKKKVSKLLKKIPCDLLHIHSSSMPCMETHVPVMVTAHWCMAEGMKRFYRPIRDADALYRNVMLPVYIKIEGNLVNKCQMLTVVSKSMQNEYLRHYKRESVVVLNGVNTEKFRPTNGNKENIILYTGMLRIGKGVLDLLEASKIIISNFPQTSIVMVGNGPLKKYLVKKIPNWIRNKVILIDHLPHAQLIRYYQRAMVYVLPSYYEGLPTTVLEAMSCQLPVVGTDIPGIRDLIEDGINGFLVPPKDPELLAKKVEKLIREPKLRNNMGAKGRAKVTESYAWNNIARNISKLYQVILR